MNNDEAKQLMTEGFELLCQWSRLIAMLPLEDWREALARAETLGMVVDPTLYRQYISSEKPEIIKSLIDAAIPLKRAVMAAQPAARKEAAGG